MSQHKDPNEGEGNRTDARRYDQDVRDFVATGKVAEAATDARAALDLDPTAAAEAEVVARRGPRLAGGTSIPRFTLVERMRHAYDNLRARFNHK